MLTRLSVVFFRRSRAAYSVSSGEIMPKFKLIHAFMIVIVTCKNENDRIKNEGSRLLARFSPFQPMGISSKGQGQLTLQSLVKLARNSNSFEMLLSKSSKLLWLSL